MVTTKTSHDRIILFVVAVLIVIGLVSVYSSTSIISPETIEKLKKKGIEASPFIFLRKQLFTLVLGGIALYVFSIIKLTHIRKMAIPLLIVSFVSLILVFTPLGISANGARRWLRFWPTSFQPSELVKLSMVIFLAWYASQPSYDRKKLRCFAVPIAVMAVFQVVFLKQPDFGAVMSLGLLTFAILFLSGVRLTFLFSICILAVPVLFKLVSEPYRWRRITAFLDPWKDPQGSGFQLVQSFIALGSGGLTGVGLGESKQKLFFLPEVHTDFIFSLIGEEAGFVGSVIVIILFLVLFVRGISVAMRVSEPFIHNLACGLSIMIAMQTVINFFVVTGMVPTKGLPLPFISYGGSSLIVNMIAVGLLLNASRYRSQAPFDRGTISEAVLKSGDLPDRPDPVPSFAHWRTGLGYRYFQERRGSGQRTGHMG